MVTEYASWKRIPFSNSRLRCTLSVFLRISTVVVNHRIVCIFKASHNYVTTQLHNYTTIPSYSSNSKFLSHTRNQIWGTAEVPDQAETYACNLLMRARLSEKEKFHLLRATSVTIAGIRAHGRARSSKTELETVMLSLYLERVVLDLKTHENGIGANLNFEMMKKRCFGVTKDMTKRKLEALGKAILRAAKKNAVPPDADNFSGLECNELFLEIKSESNNTFNPIWVKLLNQNGDIPSGVQLNDLLDQVRLEAFKQKDVQRRIYLEVSRKRASQKKKRDGAEVEDVEINDDMDENEINEGREESKEEIKAKKIKDNSPSKPKEMPEDFIPLHFMSWLKNGPASDSQHPLWIPDTGKVVMKQKADILDSNDTVSGNGKMSKYSRKAQRMEATRKDGDGKVVDLTVGEDANSGLLRESIKNSAMIVSLLQGVTDQERKNTDALVLNAAKMYELEPNTENKNDYLAALKMQKNLLVKRAQPPPPSVDESTRCANRDEVNNIFSDDELDGSHNLDVSLSDEPYHSFSPARSQEGSPHIYATHVTTSNSSNSSSSSSFV